MINVLYVWKCQFVCMAVARNRVSLRIAVGDEAGEGDLQACGELQRLVFPSVSFSFMMITSVAYLVLSRTSCEERALPLFSFRLAFYKTLRDCLFFHKRPFFSFIHPSLDPMPLVLGSKTPYPAWPVW